MTRGRPPIGQPVTIRLTADLRARLDAYATEHDMKLAEAARHLLEQALPAHPVRRGKK